MTMLRLFLVAAVLASPFAFVTFRRIRRDRRARVAISAAPIGVEPDDTGGATDDEASAVVARLRRVALAHEPGEEFELVVPPIATLGGRPADRLVVTRLVVDDLRRSGVVIVEEAPNGTLRCRLD